MQLNGILFQPVQHILVADQFAEVQIFLPFPSALPPLTDRIQVLATQIDNLARVENHGCKFFSHNESLPDANIESWLLSRVQLEYETAQQDFHSVQQEIGTLMRESPTLSDPTSFRSKRVATPLLAVGATAALFGLGVGIGSSLNCGIRGIFGSCPDLPEENKNRIKQSIQKINNISATLLEVETSTNHKMFLVTSTLHQIVDSQKQFAAIQNENWQAMHTLVKHLQQYTRESTDCQLSIFMRTKILHQSLAIGNSLHAIFASLVQYRSALAIYRSTVLASFAGAVDNFIPLPLVPKQHLETILIGVEAQQKALDTRLHLAIPHAEILTYYESKILTAVRTNELGILLVVAIPLAKTPVLMTVHQAHLIPMPTPNSSIALNWETEAQFLAVADSRTEIALLTSDQLAHCIGSKSMSICYEMFPTDRSRHTCLASLYFNDPADAIQRCRTRPVHLPQRETAVNLGNGQWLLTAANEHFMLSEISLNESHPVEIRRHPGCQSCLLSLACGSYIDGPNVRIRPDMATCARESPFRLNSTLSPLLHSLFALLPELEQLPQFSDIAEARTTLLHEVQGSLLHLPDHEGRTFPQLESIARPIIHTFTELAEEPSTNQHNFTWTHLTVLVICFTAIVICLLCFCTCPFASSKPDNLPPTSPGNPQTIYASMIGEPPSPLQVDVRQSHSRQTPAQSLQRVLLTPHPRTRVPNDLELPTSQPVLRFDRSPGLLHAAENDITPTDNFVY